MSNATKQFLAPRDCKSVGDVLSLENSAATFGRHWVMIQHDGAVILCDQSHGEPANVSVTIPRQIFQRMLTWYETEQKR